MKIALLATDNREHLKDYSNSHPHFGTAPEALLQGFALLPEVEVHVLSCVRRPMDSPTKLAQNIWYHPILVPKLGWIRTAYQGCIRGVRKKLQEIQPDIVHGQGTERDCAISAVFSGFPNVLTIHGNIGAVAKINGAKPFSYLWLNAYLERFTIPRSMGVVCITNYTKELVRELAAQTWVVPNAADTRYFAAQRALSAPDKVLLVGLVCPRKNQNAFIKALDSLAAERPFRLVFLGEAPRQTPYGAEFFELLQSRPWCQWAGFASRDQLRGYLETATALALPSVEDNCPMAVLEAMAAGVPVIAANVGGVPDLVVDGQTGWLCDPLNRESMAGAVRRVLSFPEEARAMASRARAEAETRFHPRSIAARHVEIYRELLGKAKGSLL